MLKSKINEIKMKINGTKWSLLKSIGIKMDVFKIHIWTKVETKG